MFTLIKLVPEVCCSLTSVGSKKQGHWDSDPSEKVSRPPARADQLKIFILNHKDRPSVAEWLGLGLKGLICIYNRQIKVVPRKWKICATYSGHRSHSGLWGPGNLYRLRTHLLPALLWREEKVLSVTVRRVHWKCEKQPFLRKARWQKEEWNTIMSPWGKKPVEQADYMASLSKMSTQTIETEMQWQINLALFYFSNILYFLIPVFVKEAAFFFLNILAYIKYMTLISDLLSCR